VSRLSVSFSTQLEYRIHIGDGCWADHRFHCEILQSRLRVDFDGSSTPGVPFCAAVWMAMAVVLARCSAPSRVCSIAGSRKVDGAHRFGCRMRICVLCGQAWRSPCMLELHAPLTNPMGCRTCPTRRAS
jgi:hypothetical protein